MKQTKTTIKKYYFFHAHPETPETTSRVVGDSCDAMKRHRDTLRKEGRECSLIYNTQEFKIAFSK